jgi:hypothetical protein
MDCLHGLEQAHCSLCKPKTKKTRPVEERAAELERWIPALNDDPISAAEIAEVSGLTVPQVYEAFGFIRDNSPDLPLPSDRRGYAYSSKPEVIDRYRNAAMKTALTRIRRLWRGVIKPFLALIGNEEWAQYQTKQFERLLVDIEDMVA